MLSESINFLKNKNYEEFVEDGRLIVSPEAAFLFDRIWEKTAQKGARKIVFPEQIVWVNGAPGAGKGTNTRDIMRALRIPRHPIVISDLLNDEKFKQKIDRGELIDDEEVTLLLFEKIFEETRGKGIIVDGFPRSKIQVEFIELLQKKSEKTVPIKMASVILLIDEKTSIQRQLFRGQIAIENNKKVAQEGVGQLMEVRKTDSNPDIAHARYNTFYEETYEAIKLLKRFTDHYEIDAKGSFDEVRERIFEKLKKGLPDK
ncbi:MAG: nucleoside monophosphate kinase [Puniceicoccales bacterium]|nr:nucleoside monophosphate kinase [Puniceicoccales bacterium]